MKSRHIFISYSRKDRDIVARVTELLRVGGVAVFRDEDSIPPGKPWKIVLTEHLRRCEAIFVFWSANAAGSDSVHEEYSEARRLKKDLVPVLLDETPLSKVLANYQWIDFRGFVVVRREKREVNDNAGTTSVSGGAAVGAVAGTILGPLGTIIGSIAGALLGAGAGTVSGGQVASTANQSEDVVVLELQSGVGNNICELVVERLYRE